MQHVLLGYPPRPCGELRRAINAGTARWSGRFAAVTRGSGPPSPPPKKIIKGRLVSGLRDHRCLPVTTRGRGGGGGDRGPGPRPAQAIAPGPPGVGGKGVFGALDSPDRPTHPHHMSKIFLRHKMKFIKGAGNLRPILGTQTFFWPLTVLRGRFRTAPIITVIIQVTTLKTTHLRNHAQSIQNSKF